jgi:hypothetical protein
MAAGFPDSAKLEIEFTAGTWTDVTTYVDWSTGVEIKQGRSSEFDDVSPGELSVTLYNLPDTTTSISPFTPDSPLSPYYPNVTKGKRIRYTITYASTAYQRFIGWIQAWSLNLSDSVVEATVTISAIDRLGVQNALPLNALWVEYWKNVANYYGRLWDVWPLDESVNAAQYRNVNQSGLPAVVNSPRTGTGSVTLEQTPQGVYADGSLKLTRDNSATQLGPTVACVPQNWVGSTHKQWMFWFRTSTVDQFLMGVYSSTSTNLTGSPLGRILMDADGALQWDNSPTTNVTPLVVTGTSGFATANPAGQQYWITTSQTNLVAKNQVTTTGTAGSGSTSLTVGSATGIVIGQTVTATNIPYGTLVTNVSGTTITLDTPTTGAMSSAAVSFIFPLLITGKGLPANCVVTWIDTANQIVYFTPQFVGTTLTAIANGTFTLELPSSRFTQLNGTVRYDDGQWHSCVFYDNGSNTIQVYVDGNSSATITGAFTSLPTGSWTVSSIGSFSVGGQYKNVYGFEGDITGLAASNGNPTVDLGGFEKWGFPIGNQSFSGTNAAQDTLKWLIRSDLGGTATVGTDYQVIGSDNRRISNALTTGTTLGDAIATIHRTIGGTYWVNPTNGLPTAIMNDAARPTSSTVSLSLGADDDISNGQQWAQNVQGKPTRVSVNSPAISATIVDATAETNGIPVNELNVDTWSRDANNANDVAWLRLRTSSSLRLSHISVELATAETNLYAALCGSAFPGMRITVANIPTGFIGISQTDVYVQGWVEKYASNAVLWTFDTTPADAPGEAVFDTTRFSWGDGVCSVSACTATATSLTLTWTGTSVLSTTAGDYPLDLNVNGERVTITSAPASGSSPQTVTVTRGISPTVARAHSAGEPVDLWNGYTYAF